MVCKMRIGHASQYPLATTYTSLAITNSGITEDAFEAYKNQSCKSYATDCQLPNALEQVDPQILLHTLQESCTTDAVSCFRQGLLLQPIAVVNNQSIPSNTDRKKSLELFQKSCDNGFPIGCTYASLQQNDFVRLEQQCSKNQNLFSCRELYVQELLDSKTSAQSEEKLSELCTQQNFFLACGDIGIYFSGKHQDHLAIPLLDKACTSGDARSCYWLGHHIKNGAGIIKNPKKSLELFQKSCDAGIGDACMALVEYATANNQEDIVKKSCLTGSARGCVWLGNKGENDYPYFAIACQLSENQPQACLLAGLSLDASESLWYFKRSCQTGNSQGCFHAYEILDIQNQTTEAIAFVSQSCQMGYMLGCETLGKLQLLKKATATDLSQPIQLLEMACRSGQKNACSLLELQGRPRIEKDCTEQHIASSCYTLIRFFDGSLGTQANIDKAYALAQKECEGNKNIPACVKFGFYLMSGQGNSIDKDKAYQLFLQACSAQNAAGCYNLGLMHLEKHDIQSSLPFFQQACTYKDGRGCAQAGVFLRQSGQETEGITLLETSCSLGDATGCAHFGFIQARQNKIEDAISTLGYSCTYGHPDGCFNLAVIVHQNPSLAQFLFSDPEEVVQESMHRACSLGHHLACQQKQ